MEWRADSSRRLLALMLRQCVCRLITVCVVRSGLSAVCGVRLMMGNVVRSEFAGCEPFEEFERFDHFVVCVVLSRVVQSLHTRVIAHLTTRHGERSCNANAMQCDAPVRCALCCVVDPYVLFVEHRAGGIVNALAARHSQLLPRCTPKRQREGAGESMSE
jgi:hypothetical protein